MWGYAELDGIQRAAKETQDLRIWGGDHNQVLHRLKNDKVIRPGRQKKGWPVFTAKSAGQIYTAQSHSGHFRQTLANAQSPLYLSSRPLLWGRHDRSK